MPYPVLLTKIDNPAIDQSFPESVSVVEINNSASNGWVTLNGVYVAGAYQQSIVALLTGATVVSCKLTSTPPPGLTAPAIPAGSATLVFYPKVGAPVSNPGIVQQQPFTGIDITGGFASAVVGGIKGKPVPALPGSDSILHYSGAAWKLDTALPAITLASPLPEPSGGTGTDVSIFNAHSVILGGNPALRQLTPGAASLPLVAQGGGADPAYAALTGAGIAAATITGSNIAAATITSGLLSLSSGIEYLAGNVALPSATDTQLLQFTALPAGTYICWGWTTCTVSNGLAQQHVSMELELDTLVWAVAQDFDDVNNPARCTMFLMGLGTVGAGITLQLRANPNVACTALRLNPDYASAAATGLAYVRIG